jgi:hypothetical protein
VISPKERWSFDPACREPPVAETSRPACVCDALVVETVSVIATVSPGYTVEEGAENVTVVLGSALLPWRAPHPGVD